MSDLAHRPPATIRGVALDMDGLLFETESLYWAVGEQVLQRRGKQFCRDLQQRMMGRIGVAAIEQMIQFHQLDDDPQTLLQESDLLFNQFLGDGPTPMPGLSTLIDALVANEIAFGVATSSRRQFAQRFLEPQPWYHRLAFVLTGDDVQHGKPHPEMYLRAAAALQIPPQEMLVLEDSGNGAAAGVAAAAQVIAVPSEHTRNHDFNGVAAIAQSLSDPVIRQMLGLPVSR